MDKQALETLIGALDNWAALFTLLVVVGVGGELIVHIMQSRANKKLVALQNAETIAQELEISRLKKDAEGFSLDIARANERSSEANRIAEQERLARLKIEERLAPRRINADQRARLVTGLKPLSGKTVSLFIMIGDPETDALASY